MTDDQTAARGWRTYRVPIARLVGASLVLFGLAMVAILLPLLVPEVIRVPRALVPRDAPSVLVAPPVVFTIAFVPGALVLLASGVRDRVDARWVLYAFGLSLVIALVAGFLANLLLPYAGVARPLTRVPLAATLAATIAVLAAAAWRGGRGETLSVRAPPLDSPVLYALLLVPFLSVLGVVLLNRTNVVAPLAAAIGAIALVPLAVVLLGGREWHALAMWVLSLALLYHKALWKFSGFGGAPVVVRVWELGVWTPGVGVVRPSSSTLLPLGVLFPAVARLSDIAILTEMNVVNPFLVSFVPVALFVAYRGYVGSRAAFLGAALFAFAHPFYRQYPTAGRVATPVIFLALLAVVMSDEELTAPRAVALGVALVAGLVVSHYGTAYLVSIVVLGALALAVLLRHLDGVLERVGVADGRGARADGSGAAETPLDGLPGRLDAFLRTRSRLLTWSFGWYLAAASVAWYMYTIEGLKFKLIPHHVTSSVEQFLTGQTFGGGSAARLERDYGTLSILLSKYVYVLVAALTAVGLLAAAYRRFSADRERRFGDDFLALAVTMLGVFALTFLVNTWGGGRPMMITFVFTAIFGVLGAAALGGLLDRLPAGVDGRRVGLAAFAVLLAVLLALNTGLASAVVLGGSAPSNVLVQNRITHSEDPTLVARQYRESDIQTHVWLIEHYGGDDLDAYGDAIAQGQTDWYRPPIQAETDGGELYGAWKPDTDLAALRAPGIERGYVVLLGHNQQLGVIQSSRETGRVPLYTLEGELQERNRVYTSGRSAVYYAENESARAGHRGGSGSNTSATESPLARRRPVCASPGSCSPGIGP